VRPLAGVARDEGLESVLLLQHVRGGRLRRLALQREMHPLVPAVLLGVPRRDALDLTVEP
jgi:hypothetical protein